MDRRLLKTDEAVPVAEKLFGAAMDRDQDLIAKACNEWLDCLGFRRDSGLELEFSGEFGFGAEILVTATFLSGEETNIVVASSGDCHQDSGIGQMRLLMNVNAAIEYCLQQYTMLSLFSSSLSELSEYSDTLHYWATREGDNRGLEGSDA